MKRFALLLFAIICCILQYGCEKKVPGSIYGVVLEAGNTEPMQGIGVSLHYTSAEEPIGALILRTVTAYDGRYEFNDIEAGKYVLCIELADYEISPYKVMVESGRAARADMWITPALPVLNTLDVTNITKTTAVLNGQIMKSGIPAYTERGFVYSTSPMPTLETTISKLTAVVNSDTIFSAKAIYLTEGNVYHVRAYAQNQKGIAYSSNEVLFKYDISNVYVLEDLNLMVQKGDMGEFTWRNAVDQCSSSRVAGFTDWRLPSIGELVAICQRDTFGFARDCYWSSFREDDDWYGYTYRVVYMGTCNSSNHECTSSAKVRAVRSITE